MDKSIVVSKYDPATNKYQWGWVWNGGVYNYRYVVDVDVVVKGHPSYWGFRIYDSSGFQRRKFQVNQVTELNALEKEYKVRLYLYLKSATNSHADYYCCLDTLFDDSLATSDVIIYE